MPKKEREKHIQAVKEWAEVYHRDKFKTAIVYLENNGNGEIVINKIFYQVVTKVNYLTACLWLQWRNEKVGTTKGFIKLPDKPNWLVMVRNFRRTQERKVKIIAYLKERQQRNENRKREKILD